MNTFLFGLLFGFAVGYPFGLFIDRLDKHVRQKRTRANK